MDTLTKAINWAAPYWGILGWASVFLVIWILGIVGTKLKRWRFKEWVEDQVVPFPEKSNAKGYLEASAYFVAETGRFLDELNALKLKNKKHPARKAAEEVSNIAREKRILARKLKYIEGELIYLGGLFPEIMEAREHFLKDDELLGSDLTTEVDPIRRFINPDEYEKLNSWQRSDLSLERYIARHHSQLEIGRMYERYLGYLFESDGWEVEYKGLVDGFDDLGRDLICRKDNEIEIVQAKCWSAKKSIRENVVFQLYASTIHFDMEEREPTDGNVKAVLAVTTELSDVAKEIAKRMEIDVRNLPLKKDYPMIKCNVGSGKDAKIYHLPFDLQYDKIKIEPEKGEMYVLSARDAEEAGFRRTWRWRGSKSSI